MEKREIYPALRKFGMQVDEYIDGDIRMVVTNDTDGWRTCEVKSREPNELFPEVTVSGGFASMSFRNVFVRNRNDSQELSANMKKIWDFLEKEEVKEIAQIRGMCYGEHA